MMTELFLGEVKLMLYNRQNNKTIKKNPNKITKLN